MMKPKFTSIGLKQKFIKDRKLIERVIIREMLILAEKIVNLCRNLDTYQDDTGNLRSSIGVTLFVGFKPYQSDFVQTPGKGSTDGVLGKAAGEAEMAFLAGTVVSSYYSLVIVAGMDYAEEVEARDYAVLSPGQLLAESELPKIIARIVRTVNSKK